MIPDRQTAEADADAYLYCKFGLHKMEGRAVLNYMQLCSTDMCVELERRESS